MMKIFLVKQFFKVDDIEFNYNKIKEIYDRSLQDGCDLLIFPEMTITGFPCYDSLLNSKFIEKSDKYIEKIVDYTKNKKTRIVLGCPYFIKDCVKDEIIQKSQLFNSMILINDGYIDAVSSKTNISKQNLFNEYRYFDTEFVLKSMIYENDNFDILLSDEIENNKNIFFIKERDTDFVICVDTEIPENINDKKKQLSKISKWTKKNVIYLNILSYDFKYNYKFFGEIFVFNRNGELTYQNLSMTEEIVKLETSIIFGQIVIRKMDSKTKNDENFLSIIAKNYCEKNIIFEIKEKEKYKIKEKNLKLITFDKTFKDTNIEYINPDEYIKNIILNDEIKKIIVQNIYNNSIFIK